MSTLPFMPLITAVSWATIAGVGASGLALAPQEPLRRVAPPAAPASATRIEVPLSDNPESAAPQAPAPELSSEAAAAAVMEDAPPAAPGLAALADAAGVAFAVPVAAPARTVASKADAGSLTTPVTLAGALGAARGVPVTQVNPGSGFGTGLARPRYPESARLDGRQGSVTVRFALDRSGRVMVAKVVTGSGHADLDREALETVRRRWAFPAGTPPGPFEWTAHFVLQ